MSALRKEMVRLFFNEGGGRLLSSFEGSVPPRDEEEENALFEY